MPPRVRARVARNAKTPCNHTICVNQQADRLFGITERYGCIMAYPVVLRAGSA